MRFLGRKVCRGIGREGKLHYREWCSIINVGLQQTSPTTNTHFGSVWKQRQPTQTLAETIAFAVYCHISCSIKTSEVSFCQSLKFGNSCDFFMIIIVPYSKKVSRPTIFANGLYWKNNHGYNLLVEGSHKFSRTKLFQPLQHVHYRVY